MGTLWIFRAAVSYDAASPDYCHNGLFIYSKVMVSVIYALLGLLLIALCKPISVCFASIGACF